MRCVPRCLFGGTLTPLLVAAVLGPGCTPPNRPETTVKRAPAPAPRPANQTTRLYVVQSNDTLWSIAQRFGVRGGYARLGGLNNIKPPYNVSSGLMLRIPPRPGFTGRLRPFPKVRRILGPWRPCGVKLGRPRRLTIAGCHTAYCALGPEAGERLCRCFGPYGTNDTFWYERKGRRFKLRTGERTAFSHPRTFHAARTDLDGDGLEELILATHRTTSNGIAIMWFDVEVYTPGRRVGPQIHFANAGGQDVAVRRGGDRRCSLRVVSVENQPGLWRGTGNFWVQRLHRYGRGRLLPHPKALVRRTRLGGPTFKICTSPHPSAAHTCHRVDYEVGLNSDWWHQAGRVVKRLEGRVTRVASGHLVFRPHRGPAQKLAPDYSGDWMGRFGDRRTRRLFPAEYRTADQLKHWIGRAATRVTYRAGDNFDVLWISRQRKESR
jgi:LysM domain